MQETGWRCITAQFYRAEHPLTSWVHADASTKLMDFLRLRGDAPNDSLDDCEEIFSNAGRWQAA